MDDKFIKLRQFLSGKPWYVKAVVLLLLAIVIFFNSGCAYKMHVDKVDNLTREISINPSILKNDNNW